MDKKSKSIKEQRENIQKQTQEIQEQARQISELIYKEPIDEIHEDVDKIIISKL